MMNQTTMITGIVVEENTAFSFVEISEKLQVPESLLLEMQTEGLFQTLNNEVLYSDFLKIAKACRLHKDLGVNLPGAILALNLLDEISSLEKELHILKRHF